VENATCTITGINKWTTPIEFLRAGMEAIALRIGVLFSLLGTLLTAFVARRIPWLTSLFSCAPSVFC